MTSGRCGAAERPGVRHAAPTCVAAMTYVRPCTAAPSPCPPQRTPLPYHEQACALPPATGALDSVAWPACRMPLRHPAEIPYRAKARQGQAPARSVSSNLRRVGVPVPPRPPCRPRASADARPHLLAHTRFLAPNAPPAMPLNKRGWRRATGGAGRPAYRACKYPAGDGHPLHAQCAVVNELVLYLCMTLWTTERSIDYGSIDQFS